MNHNLKNFRGNHEYNIEGVGKVVLTTDKNLSVYKCEPKFVVTYGGIEHSLINEIRGQVPDVAAQNIANAVANWNDMEQRYA